MKKKIKCNSCNTEYETIFEDTIQVRCTQANDCAGEVQFHLNEIRCYYGSGYDLNVYEFINGEIPDWIETGIICDECIKQLIGAGLIRLKRKNQCFQ